MEVAVFFVYMLFIGIPWTYLDVWYVVRKVFSKGIQRSWNRGKRFSGGEVIQRASLMNRTHMGGMRSGVLNRPSGGLGGDMRVLSTFSGTLEKGDQVLYWNSLLQYRGTQVMIRPPSYSIYNSPSTIWDSAKLDIHGKLRSRRIQWRWLQEVWRRTHWGHQILLKNQSFSLDKDYVMTGSPIVQIGLPSGRLGLSI